MNTTSHRSSHRPSVSRFGPALGASLAAILVTACGGGGGGAAGAGIQPDALPVVSFSPANGAAGVAYDAPIVVAFGRAIDQTTTTGSIAVLGPDGLVPGSVSVVGTSIRFQPTRLLEAGATFRVTVNTSLRAADGGQIAAPVSASFSTGLVLEDFFFAVSWVGDFDRLLDTDVGGDARVTAGSTTSPTPGQRWRFDQVFHDGRAAYFTMRNDQFASDAALESADGSVDALMVPYSAITAVPSGQIFEFEQVGGSIMLKSLFQGTGRALSAFDLGGGLRSARIRDVAGAGDSVLWRLYPVAPIVPAFPIASITTNAILDGELTASDPTGLRPGRFAKLYAFDVEVPTVLTVTMRSSILDSFLFLMTDNCLADADLAVWAAQCTIQANDDGGGGDPDALSVLDSRIDEVLPPGRYVLGATSFSFEEQGAFVLSTSAVPARAARPVVVQRVETATASETKAR
ncbi:MAG: Ig-like domain-containing protein [Planctomycetota bacterium]